MSVRAIVPDYKGAKKDRVENFHGNIIVYFNWVDHLMFCAPLAFPLPPTMTLGDAVTNVLGPQYGQHPDWAKVDWSKATWELDRKPVSVDFNKTLKDLGVGHKSVLRFVTPGLTGIKGSCT